MGKRKKEVIGEKERENEREREILMKSVINW